MLGAQGRTGRHGWSWTVGMEGLQVVQTRVSGGTVSLALGRVLVRFQLFLRPVRNPTRVTLDSSAATFPPLMVGWPHQLCPLRLYW